MLPPRSRRAPQRATASLGFDPLACPRAPAACRRTQAQSALWGVAQGWEDQSAAVTLATRQLVCTRFAPADTSQLAANPEGLEDGQRLPPQELPNYGARWAELRREAQALVLLPVAGGLVRRASPLRRGACAPPLQHAAAGGVVGRVRRHPHRPCAACRADKSVAAAAEKLYQLEYLLLHPGLPAEEYAHARQQVPAAAPPGQMRFAGRPAAVCGSELPGKHGTACRACRLFPV